MAPKQHPKIKRHQTHHTYPAPVRTLEEILTVTTMVGAGAAALLLSAPTAVLVAGAVVATYYFANENVNADLNQTIGNFYKETFRYGVKAIKSIGMTALDIVGVAATTVAYIPTTLFFGGESLGSYVLGKITKHYDPSLKGTFHKRWNEHSTRYGMIFSYLGKNLAHQWWNPVPRQHYWTLRSGLLNDTGHYIWDNVKNVALTMGGMVSNSRIGGWHNLSAKYHPSSSVSP